MCPAAPVLRPSYSEWRDFASYVRRVEPTICEYGGCQIVPPPEWQHLLASQTSRATSAPTAPALPASLARTQITPIRQHLAGHSLHGFSAVMELLDPGALLVLPRARLRPEPRPRPWTLDPEPLALDPWRRCPSRPSSPPPRRRPAHLTSAEERDAHFWRRPTAAPAPVYGADASELGSLFAPELREWNLGALPGGPAHDLTQSLPMAIPGLNRSMLYIGQWRSFFALHTEDCELQVAPTPTLTPTLTPTPTITDRGLRAAGRRARARERERERESTPPCLPSTHAPRHAVRAASFASARPSPPSRPPDAPLRLRLRG